MSHTPRTDEQVQLLADSAHRAAVTTIEEAGGSLHVRALAERLVDRDVTVVSTAEYEDRIENVLVSLHHDRLPRLDDAGLVEYDRDANVVSSRVPRASGVEWLDEAVPEALVDRLLTDRDDEGIGLIRGRESAIERGRQLADAAEEELFCMYVRADLLEDECLCRVREATERGVRMVLGSQNPTVRRLTRERLPEATIWEPQLDWLNKPSYPRVGRLVLADRRKVMLAILEEREPDGTYPRETAVVGDGENNPLVVLVRDLLGPRLDHLDYQSEDFRSELSI